MTDFLYRRLAYHRDGTQVFMMGHRVIPSGYAYGTTDYITSSIPIDFDPNALAAMNDIGGDCAILSYRRTSLIFLFPTPMRIRGILPFFRQGLWVVGPIFSGTSYPRGNSIRLEYSQDATELADGTWVDMGIVPNTSPRFIAHSDLERRTTFKADPMATEFSSGYYHRWFPLIYPGDEDEPRLNIMHFFSGDATYNHTIGALTYNRTSKDLGTLWKEDFVEGVGGVAPYDLRHVTALRLTFNADTPPVGGNPDQYAETRERYSNLFLYGNPETGSWRDYMQIQDSEHHDAVYAAQMDWGTAPWHSSDDKGIRVKNLSPDAEARDIDVYFDFGTIAVPSQVSDMFVLSLDRGQTWEQKVRLSSLSPGATSPVILIRRVTTEDDPLGHTQALLRTEVGEWSNG